MKDVNDFSDYIELNVLFAQNSNKLIGMISEVIDYDELMSRFTPDRGEEFVECFNNLIELKSGLNREARRIMTVEAENIASEVENYLKGMQ